MRTKLMVFTFVLVLTASLTFAADFSGEWTLNKDKSEMGEGRGRFLSTKLVVTQDDSKITIARTGQGRDGEVTREESLTLDGKENEVEGFGGSTRTVTAQWADENKTLTISSFMKMERNGEEFEITSKEVWKFDDKNLVIDSVINSPRGERKSTLLYEKAK